MGARLRWVATEKDRSLTHVLSEMGPAAEGAHLEGRAFVNGVRAHEGLTLRAGDVVEVWDARDAKGAPLSILFDEGDILAVEKPAGLATMPDHRGSRSLSESVAELLRSRRTKKKIEAHPVSRLDAPVSGVVVFALSSGARKALEAASLAGRFQKSYVAIVQGAFDGLGFSEAPVDGKPAKSRYAVRAKAREAALVDLVPLTGRTHQLRIHMAALGHPIFGDRSHGGPARITDGRGAVHAIDRILLHACAVRLSLVEGRMVEIRSEVPQALREAWGHLDGNSDAWNALAPSMDEKRAR
jgi:23S rRNA-/tRNA-specific pseudouridylate synthase